MYNVHVRVYEYFEELHVMHVHVYVYVIWRITCNACAVLYSDLSRVEAVCVKPRETKYVCSNYERVITQRFHVILHVFTANSRIKPCLHMWREGAGFRGIPLTSN